MKKPIKPSKSFKDCAPRIKTNIEKCGSITLCDIKPKSVKDLKKIYHTKTSMFDMIELMTNKRKDQSEKLSLRSQKKRLERIHKLLVSARRLFRTEKDNHPVLQSIIIEHLSAYTHYALSVQSLHQPPSLYDFLMSKKKDKQ